MNTNKQQKIKLLAAAVSLLAGSQTAQALTPWTDGNPDIVIYTSGGAAQDDALERVITSNLAASGTVHKFQDDAKRFAAYYFSGSTNLNSLPGTASPYATLAGKKIYITKRSLGAAGYGVVPIVGNIAHDNLNIFKSTANTLGKWAPVASPPNGLTGVYQVSANGTTAATLAVAGPANYLDSKVADGGFTGVDAATLLQPGTFNYPDPVTEFVTNGGGLTAGWSSSFTADNLSSVDAVVPTGGLVYGIGVTLDLYKVLQKAQILTGTLAPSYKDAANVTQNTFGRYDEKALPSLNRNFLAAIYAGSIADWADVKVVPIYDSTGAFIPVASRTAKTLLQIASDAYAAGTDLSVALPAITLPTDTAVGVSTRNTGAAIGAVAYGKLLNYPNVAGSYKPARSSGLNPGAGFPNVQESGGAGDSGKNLADWNNGTTTAIDANGNPLNVAGRRIWGFALNSADKLNAAAVPAAGTSSAANSWRYIKIDGAAPTLENVFAGAYPYWAEGEVLVRIQATRTGEGADNTALSGYTAAKLKAAKKAILTKYANDLGRDNTVASAVNAGLKAAWGDTGIFSTTYTNQAAINSIPFDSTKPVSGLEHDSAGDPTVPRVGIVPVPFVNGTGNTINTIQLK
ncbi:hypothetical protein ACH50O_02140 [Methylomonas sp. 2BW1-5-20]|uniref:hypothetical protein n=1 Tax=Methylomonas sp. 2BW1-5-20 TaxID=3376686 RepID=UPI00404EE874